MNETGVTEVAEFKETTPPEKYLGPPPKPKNAPAFYQVRRSHHQHLTKSQRNAMKEVVTRDGNGPINHPYIWTLKFHGVLQRVYMNGEQEDGRPKVEVVEQPETTNQLRARKRREKSNAATDKLEL